MKKVPLRKCTGCGEMKEKRELIRVVKAPEKKDENGNVISGGEISLDLTGRKSGRGAYVCKNADCFEKARKARRFERSLSCKIPEDVYEQMSKELENYYGEYAGITKLDRFTAELFRKEVNDMVESGFYDQWYENALVQLIFKTNFKLHYVDVINYSWTEVDSVNDLLIAKQIYLKDVSKE